MGTEKFKNLFLILIVILVIISIPYLLFTLGTLIEINYFGYINNWWVVLLFIVVLIAIFILGGINFEKKMGHFFLLLFTISFFILGFRLGVKPALDVEAYGLLLDKAKEIDQLDSVLLKLENDFEQLEDQRLKEQTIQSPDFKNYEIIFFNPGRAEVSDFNQLRIKAFVVTLENCKLNINGYSDDSGNSASNLEISKERAQHVADFIASINQETNQINAVTGFGDDHQLVENRNEMSRSKNRRVTIEIVGKTDEEAKAQRKKIRDEIDKNRADLENIKEERDSLMEVIFENVAE
jgi:outer membrane protein OmpA-like peptidoglycan-associated protein